MYLGRTGISDLDLKPAETISAAIELSRLGDMCAATGVESALAKGIKSLLLANIHPNAAISVVFPLKLKHPDRYTYHLKPEHILDSSLLPNGHAVRAVLASAAIEGYIRSKTFKFAEELRDIPGFSTDLLLAVKDTLKTISYVSQKCVFREPLGGTNAAFDFEV